MISNFKKYNESLLNKLQGPSEKEFLDSVKDESVYFRMKKFIKNDFYKGIEEIINDENLDINQIYYNVVADAISYDCSDEIIHLLVEKGASLTAYDFDCLFGSIRKHRNNIFKYLFDKLKDKQDEILNIKHIVFIRGENREEEYSIFEYCGKYDNNEILEFLNNFNKTNESLLNHLEGPSIIDVYKEKGLIDLNPGELFKRSHKLHFSYGMLDAIKKGFDISSNPDNLFGLINSKLSDDDVCEIMNHVNFKYIPQDVIDEIITSCVFYNKPKTCELLLKNGADPNRLLNSSVIQVWIDDKPEMLEMIKNYKDHPIVIKRETGLISKFKRFITNESLLDKLEGPTYTDIINHINTMGLDKAMIFVVKLSINDRTYTDLAKDLIQRFVNENSELIKNEYNGNVELLPLLECLGLCSSENYFDMVKFLIEDIKVDFHTQSEFALRYATASGNIRIVEYLLENGADPTVDNNYPLRIAKENGKYSLYNLMIQYANKNESLLNKLEGPTIDDIVNNMIEQYGENYFRRFKCIRKIIENNLIDVLKDIIIKLEYDDGYIYNIIKITFEYTDKKDLRDEICFFIDNYSSVLMDDIVLKIKRYYNVTLNTIGKSYSEVFDYINSFTKK